MPSLYLVHTTITPKFLNPRETRHAAMWKEHGAFIRKIREQYPDAELPYLALFAHGNGLIPDCVEAGTMVYSGGGVVVLIKNGTINTGNGTITLDEFVDRCAQGESFPSLATTPHIDGIVEFSPTELYPDAMERLAERYDIRRVMVE